jgi:hypothetical protein
MLSALTLPLPLPLEPSGISCALALKIQRPIFCGASPAVNSGVIRRLTFDQFLAFIP